MIYGMYYSSIGIIALIVHIIINYELMRRKSSIGTDLLPRIRYRRFLIALIFYYLSDILWGFLYDQKWITLAYIGTLAVFFTMVLSVLLWTRSVIAFTDDQSRFSKVVLMGGWLIFLTELIVLIINFFVPIVFYFNDKQEYIAMPARYVTLFMQMVLYFLSTVFALVIAYRSQGEKRAHYRTIGFSSLTMAIFIALQDLLPLMPMYAIGCMFATCTIHSFVYSDLIQSRSSQIEDANKKAFRDGLTGVRNKLAYIESMRDLERKGQTESLEGYGVIVFDINNLKTTNDTKGHAAGDTLIKNACSLICTQFKHSPVFRIGGDEFVAILHGSDYDNRETLAKEFDSIIDENNLNDGVVVASGMAVFDPSIDTSYTHVFMRADKLMYERKKALKHII